MHAPPSSSSFAPAAGWLVGAATLGVAAAVESGAPRYIALAGAVSALVLGAVAVSKEVRAWRRYLDHERHQCPITGGPCAQSSSDKETDDADD